jgi:hypothetical protein
MKVRGTNRKTGDHAVWDINPRTTRMFSREECETLARGEEVLRA